MLQLSTEDFSLLEEEPDLKNWGPERWFAFLQYARDNGGYGAVMSDIVWGENKELMGKKYAKIPGLNIDRIEKAHKEIYGKVPRRISRQTALAKTAFTPILWTHIVNAPSPKDQQTMSSKIGKFAHYPESEETLYVGAWQLTKYTWISMAARALLECAYERCNNRTPDWIIAALRITNFPTDEIIEIAEILNMQDGIRRICSISELLDEEEALKKDWLNELKEYAIELYDDDIWLDDDSFKDEIYWHDKKFGVLWNEPPLPVRAYCYDD